MVEGNTATDPAEARKRRKALLASQRQETEEEATAVPPAIAPPEALLVDLPSEPTPAVEQTALDSSATASASAASKDPKAAEDPSTARKRKAISSKADDTEKGKRKTQIRYDPEIPMTKEQLAAWRREARRVRNRESAAASRQRIRNRISELETEVDGWKTKYNEAQSRLQELEALAASQAAASSTNSTGTEGV